MARGAQERFEADQRRYFEAPNVPRFLWQTCQPYVADRERALLPRLDPGAKNLLLEVGCGEGSNLYHLARDSAGDEKTWVGVDLFFEKVVHAARQVPTVRAVCARGEQLPFRDATFRHVLSRDLFHHVLEKQALLGEIRRVCAPGGTITLIEANGRNPIIWLFGLLRRAERDVMAMRPEVVLNLMRREDRNLQVEFLEPFPIFRIAFHYGYGLPSLARFPWCRRAVSALERWVGRILPQNRWGYFRATLHLPPIP